MITQTAFSDSLEYQDWLNNDPTDYGGIFQRSVDGVIVVSDDYRNRGAYYNAMSEIGKLNGIDAHLICEYLTATGPKSNTLALAEVEYATR